MQVCVSTLLCAYDVFMTTVDVVILYVVDGQLERIFVILFLRCTCVLPIDYRMYPDKGKI